ncbi:uncharacterized protein LOC111407480 [Olea europaea var. sylvestris]|uniref:uncharacterized protein LOC111407480 n=1 Tax=Olea europaea var. sylvestris TaxID=158386 RepID=UPI000C1D5BB4|nr:uncharacterized protein LOC111407480 [Olea europaea var. sylvestris]XP_022892746.1 uncharacterized protein LOC111407480 [Olea europaea var. sylvestris]
MGREYRSTSFSNNMMQIEKYYGPPPPPTTTTRPNDFRPYSASYAAAPPQIKDWKIKKDSGKSWSFHDPEFQRKKRLASYKAYSVEGKVKGSVRKSFRWLKYKYNQVVYGWW